MILTEILFVLALLMGAIWVGEVLWASIFFFTALGVTVFGWLFYYQGKVLTTIGLCPEPKSYYDKKFWLWCFSSLVIILAAAWVFNPAVFQKPALLDRFNSNFARAIPWCWLQLIVLHGYFTNRLKDSFSKRKTVIIIGILFAILHFPNPLLMFVTAILASITAHFFLKSPNVFVLTFAMALLRTALKIFIIQDLISHGMRIGPGFWQ